MREAELFVMAEPMLVEVLGRIREADLGIELPPVAGVTGAGGDTLRAVVDRHLRDEATVPDRLAGRPADDAPTGVAPPDAPGAPDAADASEALEAAEAADDPDRQAEVIRLSAAAVEAARTAPDDDAARDLLLRLTIVRSLVAHYVAAYLGSTACPLPEELARPLWELTAPDAEQWRVTGLFRDPLPIPELASWRDVFLRTAGHEPHPLGH